jgi:hypothetical protein
MVSIALVSLMFDFDLVDNVYGQKADSNEDQLFAASFEDLVNKANLLTHDYDIQVKKWQMKENNDTTMISTTDSYLPKFQELITEAKNLHAPAKFKNVTELYLKSLESELQSNIYFRNNLESSNTTESTLSSKLYSDAFKYEIESFRAFESAANKIK